MLRNLAAELTRKGFRTPSSAVSKAIGCTEKTARSKLYGKTPVTVPEAVKIISTYFSDDSFTIDYLFSEDGDIQS